RSSTLTIIHSLSSEDSEEKEDHVSHNSSPSPESRPDNIKKVRLGGEAESITSSPLFQQLLNNSDLEVSDLESSLKLRREFQQPLQETCKGSKAPPEPSRLLQEHRPPLLQ
ncbi:hypothetical protein OTU49_008008, partial [Cherax quadricarinatus]